MFDFLLAGVEQATLCRVSGIIGFLIYMGGFAALQFQIVSANGITFSITQVLAAALVLISLIADFNLASLLIQLSYIVIGITGATIRLRQIRAFKRATPSNPGKVTRQIRPANAA